MDAKEPDFDRVAARLGATLVHVEQLLGGSSAVVHALDIATSAGAVERVVLRQHRSNDFKNHSAATAIKEFQVMSQLHNRGFAVPRPRLADEAGAWLVTDWVTGSSEVAAAGINSSLDQMVQFLVALHDLDPAELDTEAIGELEDPAVAIDQYLPASEAGESVRAALGAGAISFAPNPPRLIHGDYWPGNILWQNGRLAAVIDWEDAQLGDCLADLASARVELLYRYGIDAMEYFTDRYLAARPTDTTHLTLWEAYVSSAALATMHQWSISQAEEQRMRSIATKFFERAAAELVSRC